MAYTPFHDDRKLKSTNDILQKRFSCTENELIIWRNSLVYRYTAISDNSIVVKTSDFDYDDNNISLPLWINRPIPSILAKSVLRIFSNGSKRVTLTLYFTRQESGTFLCQGVDCEKWEVHEFESINGFVSAFGENGDVDGLLASLMSLPLKFLTANGPATKLTPPSTEPVVDNDVENTCTPSTSLSSNLYEEEVRCASNAPPVLSTPLSTKQILSQTASCDFEDIAGEDMLSVSTPNLAKFKQTPTGFKTKRNRRKTLCPNRHIDKALPARINNLEISVDSLQSDLVGLEGNIVSRIEDTKLSTKSDLKLHVDRKVETLHDTLESLKLSIAKLETSLCALNKDNHSLKTSLGTLHSELKQMKKTPCSVKNASVQCDILTPCSTCPDNKQEETSTNVSQSSQSGVDGRTNTTASHLGTVTTGDSSSHPLSTYEQEISSIVNGDEPQPPCGNTDRDIPIPVHNRFQVLSHAPTDQFGRTEPDHSLPHKEKPSPPDVSADATDSPPPSSEGTHKKHSPSQVLESITIPTYASSVLLGDSVIRNINPRRLETHKDPLFKLCVPGLSILDILRWLRNLPKQDHVKTLIVHVGVNDCPAGPIATEDWHDLINSCKQSFPAAYIAISSIIPARGKHQLNNAIAPSNRNLYTACTKLHVDMVDHYGTFVTRNGAPRQALYKDVTHPSARGTVCLAVDFKRVLPQAERPRVDDSLRIPGPTRENMHPRHDPTISHNYPRRRQYHNVAPRTADVENPGVPSMSSVADFPHLPSHNRSQAASSENFQNNNSHLRLEANVCPPYEPPISAPSTLAPQLPYPGLLLSDPTFSSYPFPHSYPTQGTHGGDALRRQTPFPLVPGFYPPLQRHGTDARTWAPPNALREYAQQLMSLASHMVPM